MGLGLIGALWLKMWYSEAKQAIRNVRRDSLNGTNGERSIEIEDSLASQLSKKIDDSKFVFGALIFWIFVFLGTYIPWKDYAYFFFVRIVAVFIAGGMLAIAAKISKPFLGGFIFMIIIFNPIIPIKLGREIWQVVDVSVILLLASFHFIVKKKVKNQKEQTRLDLEESTQNDKKKKELSEAEELINTPIS